MSLQLRTQVEERAIAAVQACLESQREYRARRLTEAEQRLEVEQQTLTAYEREGTVPHEAALRLWIQVADLTGEASSQVIYRNADRSVFDDAKRVREAVRRWLCSIDVPAGEWDTPTGAVTIPPATAADTELGQRRMQEYLRTLIADAQVEVAERRTDVAKIQSVIEHFRDDQRIPADQVDGVWTRIADDVAIAAGDFLEERCDAAAVEEAKAVRSVVQNWLQEQGHRIDTSRDFMAEISR